MSLIRVGVLRGGPSSEYEVSLKSGGTVLKHLPETYKAKDIFISRDGEWHMDGLPRNPGHILKHLDVVVNALHGEYGEDGKVQSILESHQIPYTGSGSVASAVGMNKILSKNLFRSAGLKTPLHVVVRRSDDINELMPTLFNHFLLPAIIKPASVGSSVGVAIVRYYHDIPAVLANALTYSDSALIEEYIAGREATCGVLEGFRDQDIYALFPGEILKPQDKELFDYEAKYSGKSKEIFPGNFSDEEKAEMQRMAIEAHKALGLRHYSRSDFMVHPRRGIYILETNSLPGLTNESLYPQSLESVGCTMPQFLDHIIGLALERK